MIGRIAGSIPLAIVWVLLTNRIALEDILLGWFIGFLLLTVLRADASHIRFASIPRSALALMLYTVRLFIDIVRSSIDVAQIALSPKITLNSGIIAVPMQMREQDDTAAALSAHGITITPGELVVEFSDDTLYVHCLNVEASAQTLDPAQGRRVDQYEQILGRSLR